MPDVPSWLGTVESGNLTHDAKTGLDARTDGEIARTIRYAVSHDGRRLFMPDTAMGDADVAAVIGFLRSNDPVLDPVERVPAKPRVSLQGEILLTLTGAVTVANYPATGIPVVAKGPTIEYGKYLAQDVFHCAECHTKGFGREKTTGADALAGGGEFTDAEGKTILSANLTFHSTGIKGWSRADLDRAVRDGIRPDGAVLRYPMPRFHALDDTDMNAIYAYLESVPARPVAAPRVPPPVPVRSVASVEASPAAAFRNLGCVGCHGEGAIYRGAILAARDKDEEALARWIRNPEKIRPGTVMPTFEAIVDEKAARALAAWIKSGGPTSAM
jgi:mono/diheme cytochrome c family protein